MVVLFPLHLPKVVCADPQQRDCTAVFACEIMTKTTTADHDVLGIVLQVPKPIALCIYSTAQKLQGQLISMNIYICEIIPNTPLHLCYIHLFSYRSISLVCTPSCQGNNENALYLPNVSATTYGHWLCSRGFSNELRVNSATST
jgi:hypothetical protein